jgi:hypothetical protein
MIVPVITRESVLAAIAEHDRFGEPAFLAKYGYGPAVTCRLRYRGKLYPSKAIVGVAHGIECGCSPLEPAAFSGGARHAAAALARLGFKVYRGKAPIHARLLSASLRLFARTRRTVAALTVRSKALVVGVLGCTLKKLDPTKPADRKKLGPDGKAPARELYRGGGFRLGLRYVEQRCDEGLVLSGKHGVVDLDQRIAPYSKPVREMPPAERETWGQRIRADLRRRFGRRKVRLVVLAGAIYAAAVTGCGYEVETPLAGLGQGKRLAWLSQRTSQPVRLEPRRVEDSRIRFFLPDSQDYVDPTFDFTRENRSPDRVVQRDDHYAHEVFHDRVIDGLLLSKGIVESVGEGSNRFSQGARLRLMREGIRAFYRLPHHALSMGDCGAFTYVKHEKPPFTVDEVAGFYDACGFDFGISVDHIITEYEPGWDEAGAPAAVRQRQELTLELAREFLRRSKGLRYQPMGVAQGWSPASYAASVTALQRMGYDYIAIGGVVPLKDAPLLEVVRAVGKVRRAGTRFHVLGVGRTELLGEFRAAGVASFDSTSPLRRAWMDGKNNYDTPDGSFSAIRIPQVGSNPELKRRIASGEVDNGTAFQLERAALRAMAAFDVGKASVDEALAALVAYEAIHSPGKSRAPAYRRTLEAAPWKRCPCEVCRTLGHHVILFRGAERNRRRGFHNVWVFYRRLHRGSVAPAYMGPEQLSLHL